MDLDALDTEIVALSAALALLLAVTAVLFAKLKARGRELAKAREALARKEPLRVETRREKVGLLWFPLLTVDEERKLVVSAAAGLPHCAKCVRPLRLAEGPGGGEWACGGCGEKRPGSAGDLMVTDGVVAEAISEFLARKPEYRSTAGAPPKAAA